MNRVAKPVRVRMNAPLSRRCFLDIDTSQEDPLEGDFLLCIFAGTP